MLHTCTYEGTSLWVYLSGSFGYQSMYIWDVYMESILVYCFHCMLIYLLWGWAAMNLSIGTLTTQRVARLDMYMRECIYATMYVARILSFS